MVRQFFLLNCLLWFSGAAAASYFQLLIGFSDGVDPYWVIEEMADSYALPMQINRPLGSGYIVDVDAEMSASQQQMLIQRLRDEVWIRYAELPPRLQVQFTPNEFPGSDQWYLTDSYGIAAPSAWDMTRGDRAVVIGLLDTGILPHADLQSSRFLNGYDFVSDDTFANDGDGRDADPTDPGDAVTAGECGAGQPGYASSWHGLQVAGVIAATADNGAGIAGVDHRARLLPVRVLGKCGGDFIDVLEAMRWAAGLAVTGVPANPNPVDVINMSFSGTGVCSQPVQDVIDEVADQGVVIVAAAGNEGANVNDQVPANCQRVIAVAATDRSGDGAGYANLGSKIDLAAPGGAGADVIRTLSNTGAGAPANDTVVGVIGSSFSAAMVTGGVALMRAASPALSLDEVLFYLQNGAQAFPPGSTCNTANCGAGILNLNQSLRSLPSPAPSSQGTQSNPASSSGGGGCVLESNERRAVDILGILFLLWCWRFAVHRQQKRGLQRAG